MSAKKGDETKIPHDDGIDSGFLSGPLDTFPDGLDSGECDDRRVISDSSEQKCEFDSGVVECLSERLSEVQVRDTAIAYPTITLSQVQPQDFPPISILFDQDSEGDTQLHIASVHGCQKSVGTLIRVCPEKAWLSIPNDFGHTPLHLAVMSGNDVVTRMLVIAGVSLDVRDRTGETPLHKATSSCHIKCLHALLAPVPENPHRRLASVLNQKNYNGQTCVHLAASGGHIEALQMLVYYGADVNARESLAGWTALHIAARRGDARLVQFLRSRCAGVLERARDYAGRSARRLARRTPASRAFNSHDSDYESDTDDDDMYDSDSESLFEKLRESMNPINVA